MQPYLLALPIVDQAGNLNAIAEMGPLNMTAPIPEGPVDPRTVELTALRFLPRDRRP